METSKIIISRGDTRLMPVTQGELVLLSDQLRQFVNPVENTVAISCDFLKAILVQAIKSY